MLNRFAVSCSLVLVLSFLLATAASAVVHSYTVTGSVIFLDVPEEYFLEDEEPFSGGETFTLTFDLDDASPQSSTNGSTVASYDAAISNWSLSFSNGLDADATTGGVLAAVNTGGAGNHQWSNTFFSGSPTFTTTLPDPIFATNDNTFEMETFGLEIVGFSMFDSQSNAYVVTPPELLAATLTVFETPFLDIVWSSFENPGAQIQLATSVSNVVVVSAPTPVPVFGLPGMALLVGGLGAVGAAGVGAGARRQREN